MEIRDFDRVRVGQSYPSCFDIAPIQFHESYGVYATTYTYENERIELRKRDNAVALFTFKSIDLDLPKGWENSELLWSNK